MTGRRASRSCWTWGADPRPSSQHFATSSAPPSRPSSGRWTPGGSISPSWMGRRSQRAAWACVVNLRTKSSAVPRFWSSPDALRTLGWPPGHGRMRSCPVPWTPWSWLTPRRLSCASVLLACRSVSDLGELPDMNTFSTVASPELRDVSRVQLHYCPKVRRAPELLPFRGER